MALSGYWSDFYRDPDSTTCDIFPTDQGWRVLVRLRRQIPLRERREVLEWLFEYRAEIRQQHPLWVPQFIDKGNELILDFLVADSPRQVLDHVLQNGVRGGYQGTGYGSY